jgi:hypothetical protein
MLVYSQVHCDRVGKAINISGQFVLNPLAIIFEKTEKGIDG